MRITFEDKSFIEIQHSSPGKVHVSVVGRDAANILKINVNSAEVSYQQLVDLIASLGMQLPAPTITPAE